MWICGKISLWFSRTTLKLTRWKKFISLKGILFLASFGNVDGMWQFYIRLWFGSNIAILDYPLPSFRVKTWARCHWSVTHPTENVWVNEVFRLEEIWKLNGTLRISLFILFIFEPDSTRSQVFHCQIKITAKSLFIFRRSLWSCAFVSK